MTRPLLLPVGAFQNYNYCETREIIPVQKHNGMSWWGKKTERRKQKGNREFEQLGVYRLWK